MSAADRPDPADTPAGGLVVAGPWAKRRTAGESQPHVLEPVPDDVLEAAPVARSRWQERLTVSAGEPVAPLVFRDPERALATTRYVTRELARMAVRRALRPWEAARVLPPIGRGLRRGLAVWWRWVAAHDVRDDHVRRPGARVSSLAEVTESRKLRATVTATGAGVTSIGELVGYLVVGIEIPVGTGLLVCAVAYAAGRERAERTAVLVAGGAGLRPGVPLGLLAKGVLGSLADSKVPADVAAAPAERRWGWSVTVVSEEEITDKAVRAMERRLRARRGSILAVADPDDAARTVLRIVHTDLLAQVGAPPAHKPLSLTITEAADLGKVMDGERLLLELLRVHALVVGGTGSGKSSALWTLLDFLTACRDVVVLGIDLTGGPAFQAWGDCVQDLAKDPEPVREMLTRLIRVAKARTERLGARSRPVVGGPPPGDENWDPATDGPAIVVIIDEYPTLIDQKDPAGKKMHLGDLVTTLARIGRKVAVQVVLAAQKAGRSDLGNTTIRAMAEVQVLLPCAAGDVDMLWPSKRAEGWRPDLLRGASGRNPNDAGKAYVSASGHDEPRVSRFYRLTQGQIHSRALARMASGMPVLDGYSKAAFDSDVDITDLIVREIPKVLADMAAAFDTHGVAKLPSANAVTHLVDTDPDDYRELAELLADPDSGMKQAQDALSRLLAPHGVAPGQLGGLGNPRGYRRADINRAVSGDLGAP